MKQIVLDFETFYSDEYSLRKMTPVEYILDPRFEVTGCAVIEDDQPAVFMDGLNFARWARHAHLEECVVISHNALFDMCILAWRYHVVPKLMVDTLGMARATVYHQTGSVSLANVAAHLGLQAKGGFLTNVKGMNAAAIKANGLWDHYAEYACTDAELAKGIYKILRQQLPVSELIVNDMVLRCAVEPQFLLDRGLLNRHLAEVKASKDILLAKAMLVAVQDKAELMSNDQFAEALRNLGVDPPTKISKVTGRVSYAFAKTDPGMIKLAEHPSTAVQILVAARLGHKSTLEETRTEKLIKIGHLWWPTHLGKPKHTSANMPIPLRYAGAHTHRLSGDWGLNLQNLPRGSNLRHALVADEGYKVLTVDSSQIEARIVGCLAGQNDLTQAFENGEDIYSMFASDVYARPINKKDNPTERFVGKQAILGLGFGMGAPRFYDQIRSDSHKQNLTVEMSVDQAQSVVNLYRSKYPAIPMAWKTLTNLMPILANGGSAQFGPVVTENHTIRLPNGLRLFYHELGHDTVAGEWSFKYGRETKRLFGGKLMENIVQALARIIVMDAAVRIKKLFAKLGIQLAMQVHDELVYIVPDEFVTVATKIITEEMNRRPLWMPNLPLACETGVGQSYGQAK